MKQRFITVLILIVTFIIGTVAGWKLREYLGGGLTWASNGKSVFPSGVECSQDFQEGLTSLENVKNKLGNPTNIDIDDGAKDAFLQLYYRTMKDKDAGCTYWFDKAGVLRKILLRGSPVT